MENIGNKYMVYVREKKKYLSRVLDVNTYISPYQWIQDPSAAVPLTSFQGQEEEDLDDAEKPELTTFSSLPLCESMIC